MAQFLRPASDITIGAGISAVPASSLSFIANPSSTTTSVTIPAHAVGDLILVLASSITGTTIPTLATGYTNLMTTSGTTVTGGSGVGIASTSSRLAYKIATSTSDTCTGWTNAASMRVLILRGNTNAAPTQAYTRMVASGSTVYAVDAWTGATAQSWANVVLGGNIGSTVTNNTGLTERTVGTAYGSDVFGNYAGGNITFGVASSGIGYVFGARVAPTTGAASVASLLDETVEDDTDYAHFATTGSVLEVKLGSATDPVSSTGHIVRWAARSTGSGGAESATIALYQGATLVATLSTASLVRTTFTAGSATLTSGQADAITDYTDLRVRVTPSFAAGESADLSWVEMEVPDVASGTIYQKQGVAVMK